MLTANLFGEFILRLTDDNFVKLQSEVEATNALVDWELADLGEHRLKDFAEPVWLFQLGQVMNAYGPHSSVLSIVRASWPLDLAD